MGTKAHTDQAQAAIEAMAAIEAHTKANMVASDPTTTTTVANRLSAIITKADTDQAQAAIAAIEAHTKTNMVASDPITTTTMANRLSDITKAHTDQAQAAIEAMVATEAMAATE